MSSANKVAQVPRVACTVMRRAPAPGALVQARGQARAHAENLWPRRVNAELTIRRWQPKVDA